MPRKEYKDPVMMKLKPASLISQILSISCFHSALRKSHGPQCYFKHGCLLCSDEQRRFCYTDVDVDSLSVTDLLWCTVSSLPPPRYDLDCKSDNLSKHVSVPFTSAVQQSVTNSWKRCAFIPVQYLSDLKRSHSGQRTSIWLIGETLGLIFV